MRDIYLIAQSSSPQFPSLPVTGSYVTLHLISSFYLIYFCPFFLKLSLLLFFDNSPRFYSTDIYILAVDLPKVVRVCHFPTVILFIKTLNLVMHNLLLLIPLMSWIQHAYLTLWLFWSVVLFRWFFLGCNIRDLGFYLRFFIISFWYYWLFFCSFALNKRQSW